MKRTFDDLSNLRFTVGLAGAAIVGAIGWVGNRPGLLLLGLGASGILEFARHVSAGNPLKRAENELPQRMQLIRAVTQSRFSMQPPAVRRSIVAAVHDHVAQIGTIVAGLETWAAPKESLRALPDSARQRQAALWLLRADAQLRRAELKLRDLESWQALP
jgi:hypothetical protein